MLSNLIISPSLVNALKLTEKPKIAGSIKGSGILKGTLKRPELKAKLTAKQLVYNEFKQGKEALVVDADLEVSEAGLFELKKLQAKSGKNQITATGRATEPYAITWDIKAVDLKQFSPQLSGSVVGKGFFKGSLDKPQINLKLSAFKADFANWKSL